MNNEDGYIVEKGVEPTIKVKFGSESEISIYFRLDEITLL